MGMKPIQYLFEVCDPSSKIGSGQSFLENVLEYDDAREHLGELTQVDPSVLSNKLLRDVRLIIEIYQHLIQEMLERDAGENENVGEPVVYSHSLRLLEEVACLSDELSRQHAAIEAEELRRLPAIDIVVDPDARQTEFWCAYLYFCPDCEFYWPEVGEKSNL